MDVVGLESVPLSTRAKKWRVTVNDTEDDFDDFVAENDVIDDIVDEVVVVDSSE